MKVKTINKTATLTAVSESGVSSEDLLLINNYTLKPLKQEDVFVFSVVLCDNEIDRDFECFTTEALYTLGELFLGKTAIFNHSMRAEDQTARTFKTQVVLTDDKNSTGEAYVFLKAWAYMLKTDKNADIIKEIEAGIKKETSVGCSVKKCTCSICGKNIRNGFCSHKKGSTIDSKLCYFKLSEPTDAYEWSFVAVPAQRNAGVTKAFSGERELNIIRKMLSDTGEITLSQNEKKELLLFIEQLEKSSEDAEEYRKQLENDVVSLAAVAFPAIKSDEMEKICASLSSNQLRVMKKGFCEKRDSVLPVSIQTATNEGKTENSNDDYLI